MSIGQQIHVILPRWTIFTGVKKLSSINNPLSIPDLPHEIIHVTGATKQQFCQNVIIGTLIINKMLF